MSVPAGVIVAWPGAASGIPSGWSRVTSLDSRFVKGAAAAQEADETGGSATHTHTSPAHSHTGLSAHTHAGGTTGAPTTAVMYLGSSGNNYPVNGHTHSFSASGAASGSTTGATVATWQTASNHPPYVEVIFITPLSDVLEVPVGAWAWWAEDALPSGWSLASETAGRFLRGAASAGDGGATGGAATHKHVADAHVHTTNHTHNLAATGGVSGVVSRAGVSSAQNADATSHLHTVLWSDGNLPAATSADTSEDSALPPYRKLAVIEPSSDGPPPGRMIAAYLGALASIPTGWVLCDGSEGTPDMRGRFAWSAEALGDVGDAGGAVGHGHTPPAGHVHNNAHQHTVTFGGSGETQEFGRNDGDEWPVYTNFKHHSHSAVASASGGSGTTAATVQGVNAVSDSQPPFRTVLFIQLQVRLDVTVTEPEAEGTVSAPAFEVAWDAEVDGSPAAQNDYRVRIYDEAQAEVLYDSGQTASATQQHTVGSWAPENNTAYSLVVDVTGADNVTGSSGFHPFTTSWTPPATITGLAVTPVGGAP